MTGQPAEATIAMAQQPLSMAVSIPTASITRGSVSFILFFFGIALLVRLALLLQPLAALDALFIPDDAYYTLSIARSVMTGHAPSVGGGIPTTGFQPLLVLFQLPLFLFGADGDFPVKGTLLAGAIFGAANVATLGLLVARIANKRAAALAMLIAALHPIVIKNDLNGLETSLAGLLALLVLLSYTVADERPREIARVCLGLACGFALLARIDNCFLVALVVLFGSRRWGLRAAITVALTAGFVVLPYWLYCVHLSGSPIPESGHAVKQIVDFHRDVHLGTLTAFSAGLTTIGFWLAPGATPGPWLTALGIIALNILLFVPQRLRRLDERGRSTVAIAALAAAILLSFYVLYLPAFWFFERYFDFVLLVLIMLTGIGLAELTSGTPYSFASPVRTALAAGVLALFSLGCVSTWRVFLSQPEASVDGASRGAKGYRGAARAILQHLPDGAVVGAMQSGALGCYARNVRVVNLDGVVNAGAFHALRQHAMGRYLADEGIGYFADWQVNLDMLRYFYGDQWQPALLQPIFSAQPQGGDQTTLYALNTRPDRAAAPR
jgi:hypothetical protein